MEFSLFLTAQFSDFWSYTRFWEYRVEEARGPPTHVFHWPTCGLPSDTVLQKIKFHFSFRFLFQFRNSLAIEFQFLSSNIGSKNFSSLKLPSIVCVCVRYIIKAKLVYPYLNSIRTANGFE